MVSHPLPKEDLKQLNQRSDLKAALWTGTFVALWCSTASLTVWTSLAFGWLAALIPMFLHGTVSAFLVNGMHELNHETVFKTRWLNGFFANLLSFPGWINPHIFRQSHHKHHRFTLHPPRDQEELPNRFMTGFYLLSTVINVVILPRMILATIKHARGRMNSAWEESLFPTAESRHPAQRWAQVMLTGHIAILILSALTGWWALTVVFSMSPMIGRTLQALCNNTQHAGLGGDVDDWRIVCRSIKLNPVCAFLYWNMHYHIEHHMFTAVPCYNLPRLHKQIAHDLPEPSTLSNAWKKILSGPAKA